MQHAETISQFPRLVSVRPEPAPAPAPRASSEIRICGVARRLGIADREMRAIIATIRLMIDKRGFPLPKTPRFIKGEPIIGSRAVYAGSVWDRDPVDIWFDGDLPPPVAAARRTRTVEQLRADLEQRARELVG